MQLCVIGLNVPYAVSGVMLMYLSRRVFDILMPEVDVPAELQKGNVALCVTFRLDCTDHREGTRLMSSAVGCHSRSVRRILRVGHLAPVVALLVCPRSVHAQDVRGKLGKARHALDRATEERQTRRATERFDPIFKKNKENAKRWRYAETLDYVKLIRANKDSLTPR